MSARFFSSPRVAARPIYTSVRICEKEPLAYGNDRIQTSGTFDPPRNHGSSPQSGFSCTVESTSTATTELFVDQFAQADGKPSTTGDNFSPYLYRARHTFSLGKNALDYFLHPTCRTHEIIIEKNKQDDLAFLFSYSLKSIDSIYKNMQCFLTLLPQYSPSFAKPSLRGSMLIKLGFLMEEEL